MFSFYSNTPHYLFPADFTAAHDHYMKRKRKRMEKENEERRREYEKEAKERELQRIIEQEKKAEEFIKNKSKYFDITPLLSDLLQCKIRASPCLACIT